LLPARTPSPLQLKQKASKLNFQLRLDEFLFPKQALTTATPIIMCTEVELFDESQTPSRTLPSNPEPRHDESGERRTRNLEDQARMHFTALIKPACTSPRSSSPHALHRAHQARMHFTALIKPACISPRSSSPHALHRAHLQQLTQLQNRC
jgi:hypothetical protein